MIFMNELLAAARDGSTERTLAALSRGTIDINQGDEKRYTPLMYAVLGGYSRVVRILLNKGANKSIVNHDGTTALYCAVLFGHLHMTNLLLKAGAEVDEAMPTTGLTSLHTAAEDGRLELMGVLVKAGANPNSRALDGSTPLYHAAVTGQMDAIKMLLREKADPLLATSATREILVPLDVAAEHGHLQVVRELVQELGVEGCGGATGGVMALTAAAAMQHLEVLACLTDAGVVDTGAALIAAVQRSREASVNFLLQQVECSTDGESAAYLTVDGVCASLATFSFSSSRIVRLLIDAGADATSTAQLRNAEGRVFFHGTPLAYISSLTLSLRKKQQQGDDSAEKPLHSLEATRRLLLRVDAIHAVSWLWARDVPSIIHPTVGDTSLSESISTPLTLMLPILRRRAGRPRVLLSTLFRHSTKPL